MAGVNKVIIIGNLGSDPEVRSLPSGSKVANFSVATSESYTGKDGQKVEQTEWHRVELWDGLANVAEQYLRKGSQVFIEGRIRSEEYQDKNGMTVRGYKIRANGMTMLGARNSSEAGSAPAARPAASPSPISAPEPESPMPFVAQDGEDDLPF